MFDPLATKSDISIRVSPQNAGDAMAAMVRTISGFAKHLLLSLVLLVILSGGSCKPSLSPEHLKELAAHFEKKPPRTLQEFWQRLEQTTRSRALQKAVQTFRHKKIDFERFHPEQKKLIYRSLGLYTRSRYRQEMLGLLAELIALPSYRVAGIPSHKNPAILKTGQSIAAAARRSGLRYKNYENRIFEVFLKGKTEKNFGIYTHADVVPVIRSLWQRSDGSSLDPFRMQIIGGKLYGRGTQDDKGSIVAALFAMRSVQEANFHLRRGVRLLIETTEETGGDAMEYYKDRGHPLPLYNIVLDSKYPVVVAEKGFGVIQVDFEPVNTKQKPQIYSISGGAAVNQIPALSTTKIKSKSPHRLKRALDALATDFVKKNRKGLRIATRIEAREVQVDVHGISAHSSEPESGLNPLTHAIAFLELAARSGIPFAENEYMQAIRFVSTFFGLDHRGRRLGLNYSDDFMGPLTFAVTQLEDTKAGDRSRGLSLRVNVRLPGGLPPEELEKAIRKKFTGFRQKSKVPYTSKFELSPPMQRNTRGAWIQNLLNIFEETTGRAAQPISSSGATTARQLPNGINFGPAMPEEKYRGHTANEFKRVENFLLDAQMFTEMLLRIGNLEKME